jgi:hypothetical protein
LYDRGRVRSSEIFGPVHRRPPFRRLVGLRGRLLGSVDMALFESSFLVDMEQKSLAKIG